MKEMNAVKRKQVILVESSVIIQQGLTKILNDSLPELDIVVFSTVDALHLFEPKTNIGLVIINCALVENDPSQFDVAFQHTPFIGLVTNSFFREHTNLFKDFIYLTDSTKKISGIVKRENCNQPAKKIQSDSKLTSRESEVLELLIKGYSNKQIAGKLHISIHTVITHRQNITTKLGIKSIAGLTIYGVINNIIDIEDYLHH